MKLEQLEINFKIEFLFELKFSLLLNQNSKHNMP